MVHEYLDCKIHLTLDKFGNGKTKLWLVDIEPPERDNVYNLSDGWSSPTLALEAGKLFVRLLVEHYDND